MSKDIEFIRSGRFSVTSADLRSGTLDEDVTGLTHRCTLTRAATHTSVVGDCLGHRRVDVELAQLRDEVLQGSRR